jgi:hypothetical protein
MAKTTASGLIDNSFPHSLSSGSRPRPASGAVETLLSLRLDLMTLRLDRLALMQRTWRGSSV